MTEQRWRPTEGKVLCPGDKVLWYEGGFGSRGAYMTERRGVLVNIDGDTATVKRGKRTETIAVRYLKRLSREGEPNE